MFIDTITYEDFNGNTCSQDVYFNISKMKAIELEAMYPGGYGEHLQKLTEEGDMQKILGAFKEIVKMAYGVKSEDGKRFIQTEEEYQKFEESPAYDEFMMKLMTEEDYALDFVLGTMPSADGVTRETILKEMNTKGLVSGE